MLSSLRFKCSKQNIMKDFKNKVVAITGAGSGMGRAYAIEFGKLGAKLALADWNED